MEKFFGWINKDGNLGHLCMVVFIFLSLSGNHQGVNFWFIFGLYLYLKSDIKSLIVNQNMMNADLDELFEKMKIEKEN